MDEDQGAVLAGGLVRCSARTSGDQDSSSRTVAPELAGLTEQELRLLAHIAEGLTNRQIADQMSLAEKTVKNYVSNILAKLGLDSRTQAALMASKLLDHPATTPRVG